MKILITGGVSWVLWEADTKTELEVHRCVEGNFCCKNDGSGIRRRWRVSSACVAGLAPMKGE